MHLLGDLSPTLAAAATAPASAAARAAAATAATARAVAAAVSCRAWKAAAAQGGGDVVPRGLTLLAASEPWDGESSDHRV